MLSVVREGLQKEKGELACGYEARNYQQGKDKEMEQGGGILPDLLQASLVFETRGCGVGSFILTGHLTETQVHLHVSPF